MFRVNKPLFHSLGIAAAVTGCLAGFAAMMANHSPPTAIAADPTSIVSMRSEEARLAAMSFISSKQLQSAKLDVNALNQFQPTAAGTGARTAMVHLFEWTWPAIAAECENFLGPKGYAAVQVSPPMAHRVFRDSPSWATPGHWRHSWAQRYQPVRFNSMTSRSGDLTSFTNMVNRCAAVGVSIYVDAVVNHTVGADAGSGTASDGSAFNATTGSFPQFGSTDFHADCPNGINYGNAWEVQNCWLSGLMDLNTGANYVQQTLADYMNWMMSLGVKGFRIDAAKHMAAGDIAGILGRLNTTTYGTPYIFQEVIDMGGDEPIKGWHYYGNGSVTDFEYGKHVNNILRYGDIKDFGNAARNNSSKSVVFTDNHDNQRGHGAGSYNTQGVPGVLTFYSGGDVYKLGNIAMLAWPYGYPQIMSSYDWQRNIQSKNGQMKDLHDWIGPPSNLSGQTNSAQCFTARSGSWDNLGASGGWICEHRWREIANMVQFRNATSTCADVTDWQSENNVLAFGRCGLGFVSVNQRSQNHVRSYQTKLPAGQYCDVISGELNSTATGCSGTTVTVGADGMASVTVPARSAIALHQEQRLSGTGTGTNGGGTGNAGGMSRTVIMIYGETQAGQDMFVRGGIDHTYAAGIGRTCVNYVGTTNGCNLPITYNNNRKQHTLPAEYAWQVGDYFLDWYGAEATQQGTPMGTAFAWTIDKTTAASWGVTQTVDEHGYGITPLNTYGAHFWLADLMIDCSKSVNGWFEVKSFITNGPGWEVNVTQANRPWVSGNHFAQCGKKNVFWRGSSNAIIENL